MRLKIRIPSKLNSTAMIKLMLIFVCFERLLESIGMPHAIVFLLDLGNIYLFFNIAISGKLAKIFSTKMVTIHFIIFVIGIGVALKNNISILLIIWAIRNLFRFYIFFTACVIYLRQEDVKDIYDFLEKLFYLNIVVLVIQYAMGYRQDFLGGLFGSEKGANAYCNIFILMVCNYSIAKWLKKQENTIKVVAIILMSFVIAVIAEIKVLFFEIILIVALSIIIIQIVERKYMTLIKGLIITTLVILCISVSADYILKLYDSKSNADFLSIEGLTYILTRDSGYTGVGDLNRLTAINTINQLNFFNVNFLNKFLGMGLGAAEYSNFSNSLQSAFYIQHNHLHYYWFSHVWMYLECGYFGLVGYMVGFFSNIPYGIKLMKKMKRQKIDSSLVVTGIILSVMTIVIYIYNQSLRIESAYLLYFGFAVIFIGGKEVYGNKSSIS